MLRYFGAGVVLGTFVWPWLPVPLLPAALAATAFAVAAALSRRDAVSGAAFALAGLAFGFALLARLTPGPELVGPVHLRGVVASAAEGRRADVELAAAGRAGGPSAPARGRVRVIFPERSPPPGTSVIVAGTARRIDPTHLPGEPDPVIAAARSAVRSEVVASDAIRLGLDRPPPDLGEARHGALLRALVDGETAELDPAETALLKRTGTWHLVSISGLHVGMGAAFGWAAVWLLSRPMVFLRRSPALGWLCAFGGILGAAGYAELADWGVPARRAVYMTAATLFARAGARRPESGRTLAFAAVAVLVADPTSVGSLGFQLSFLALLGMIVVTPRVERLVPPDLPRLLRGLLAGLGASAGATVGTLPVVALNLQQLSPLSPLANLWAVPWIGGVATPLAVFASALPDPWRALLLAFADAAIDLGLAGLKLVDVTPAAPATGVAGAFVLGGAIFLWRREVLALTVTVAALEVPRLPHDDLVVTFLSIGQGDATLVEWPDGTTWLVDGGPPGQDLLRWLRARGIRHLDAVFLSHLHPDHYGGLLPVLAALPVDTFVARDRVEGMDLSRVGEWTTGHPSLVPRPVPYDDADENNKSEVLRLRFGDRTLLLPGDAEAEEEEAMVAAYGEDLAADVLKLGHHGSRTSSTEAWLAAVHPQVAVIECGFDNRYHHPNREPLQALHRLLPDTPVWRTDRDGSIEVRTDGHDLRVRVLGEPARWRLR